MLPSMKDNINCIFCALTFGDILPLYIFSNKFIICHDCWGISISGTYTGDGERPGVDFSCIVNGTRASWKFLLFLCLLLMYIVSLCWIWSLESLIELMSLLFFFSLNYFFALLFPSYWLLWFSFVVTVDTGFFLF